MRRRKMAASRQIEIPRAKARKHGGNAHQPEGYTSGYQETASTFGGQALRREPRLSEENPQHQTSLNFSTNPIRHNGYSITGCL
ncbi:MAG: hypothetical protein KA239_09805 [Bacteroidia bacterium]|nr:hypothetical protein [Bacteroidia bacterium]MBP6722608.1 hypothetical protein [Bacteroidia bacterium]